MCLQRARLQDNQDGSYTCKYRAWVSGAYNIAIWLNGEQLAGSPFTLNVLSTRAQAIKCELRGTGLCSAISRETASFEVEFVDAFGQVRYASHAVSLPCTTDVKRFVSCPIL